MASKKIAQPKLRSLVEQIQLSARVAGSPIPKHEIASALGIQPHWLSSLFRKEREGQEIPEHYFAVLRTLYRKYLKDVHIKADEAKSIGVMEEEIIRLRAQVAYLISVLFSTLSKKEREKAEAIIEEDAERQIVEVQEKGSFS